MIPFIVKGTIEVEPYMSDTSHCFEDIRIVIANDPEEAENKYERFWEQQDDQYGDSCFIMGCEVMETLL